MHRLWHVAFSSRTCVAPRRRQLRACRRSEGTNTLPSFVFPLWSGRTIWEERNASLRPNHTNILLCTTKEFACVLGIMDVTNRWKREVSTEKEKSRNAGCGHIHQKKRRDDEGGNWRAEGAFR